MELVGREIAAKAPAAAGYNFSSEHRYSPGGRRKGTLRQPHVLKIETKENPQSVEN
jgi:hypothetical protein